MLRLVAFLLFTKFTSAIWPKPTTFEHGDEVLFLPNLLSFNWLEDHWKPPDQQYQQPFQFTSTSGSSFKKWKNLVMRRPIIMKSNDHESLDSRGEGGISGDEIIEYAMRSAQKTIFAQGLYPWKFHPRGWKEPSREDHNIIVPMVDVIQVVNDDDDPSRPFSGDVDESYTVILDEDGRATIRANSSIGIARGLSTFTQLFYSTSDGKHVYTPFAPVYIYDAPKFQHRGLNLDISRNWFSVDDIKRQIDALAFNKMNRLHLHITDSQSWPLEIPSMPELSAKGAYRPDLVYAPEDFVYLQRHAAIQGIELITEIDMPGHTSSIYHSYPDLIAAFNQQPDWPDWAAEPPSGTLKLNSSAVYEFLDTLFSDLLPRVLPYTNFFHTGGDEVNKNAYTLDETVKSNDSAVLQPLMQKFIDTIHDKTRAEGLTPIVWEEMLLEWNLTLGPDVIVQSWRSDEAVKKIVESGHKAIAGNYKFWYLDCGKGQWLSFPPPSNPSNPASDPHFPYNDYCSPYHNWRAAYAYNPLSSIPSELHHLVIGGEAHMWSEQTDPINVDSMIWPRAAAVAEVLWSGPVGDEVDDVDGGVEDKKKKEEEEGAWNERSQQEATPRITEMRERLVAKGIRADSISMAYCTMGEGECEYWEEGQKRRKYRAKRPTNRFRTKEKETKMIGM